MPYDQNDETVVWFSVPLDGPTIERLMHLSTICRAAPVEVAASLLRDVLAQDAFEHGEFPDDGAAARHLN